MNDNLQEVPFNPPSLLAAQAKFLAELVEMQKIQQQQILNLQKQNERVIALLAKSNKEENLHHVKVENINMPFWNLVGFIFKVTIASIPAAIVMTIIYILFFGGMFTFLGGL